MVNANELRIGNWVISCRIAKSNEKGEKLSEYKSIKIQITKEDFLHEGFWVALDTFAEPIPLTPEILEKAGFGYDAKRCRYSLGEFSIVKWNSDGYLLSLYEPFEIHESPKMKLFNTVHELQNVYWSLCGSELPITL